MIKNRELDAGLESVNNLLCQKASKKDTKK